MHRLGYAWFLARSTLSALFEEEADSKLRAANSWSRDLSNVKAVGMDEFVIKKGHRHYATVIVDL